MSKNKQSGKRRSVSQDPFTLGNTQQREDLEKMAEDLFCMETYLQWLQVHRQQCINLEFARPDAFSKGELAALNRAIVKLEQIIHRRNEDLASIFPSLREVQ